MLLSTSAEPPRYAKAQRGKVVDADDEQEDEVAESRRKKSEETGGDRRDGKREDRGGH